MAEGVMGWPAKVGEQDRLPQGLRLRVLGGLAVSHQERGVSNREIRRQRRAQGGDGHGAQRNQEGERGGPLGALARGGVCRHTSGTPRFHAFTPECHSEAPKVFQCVCVSGFPPRP